MENDPLKSFQNKLSLDNLDGITILTLYSHTLASQKSNITDKYVKEFIKLFKNAGASEVRAQTLQSVAVKEQAGASDVVKFLEIVLKKIISNMSKGIFEANKELRKWWSISLGVGFIYYFCLANILI